MILLMMVRMVRKRMEDPEIRAASLRSCSDDIHQSWHCARAYLECRCEVAGGRCGGGLQWPRGGGGARGGGGG